MENSNSKQNHDDDNPSSTLSTASTVSTASTNLNTTTNTNTNIITNTNHPINTNKPIPLLSILMKNTNMTIQEITTNKFKKEAISSSNWIKTSTECNEALHHLSMSSSKNCMDMESTIQTLLTYFKKKTNYNDQIPKSSSNYHHHHHHHHHHEPLSISYIRATFRCVMLLCVHPTIKPTTLPKTKIATDMIQTLSSCICKRIQYQIQSKENPDPNNNIIDNHIIHSSLIVCHDLLHDINPLITNDGKAFLLPCMWRSLCDILHHISLYYHQHIFQQCISNTSIPYTVFQIIFNHSLTILIECLEDGETNLKKQIFQIMQTTSIPNDNGGMSMWTFQSQLEIEKRLSHQQHQLKLTTFLLARLGSLFSSFMNISNSNSNSNNQNTKNIETSILKHTLRCLAKLRGLGESGKIMMEYYRSKNNKTNDQNNNNQQRISMQLQQVQISLCTHACQIGQKVDQTLWKILFRSQFADKLQPYTQSNSYLYLFILNVLKTIENKNENQMLHSIPSKTTTTIEIGTNPLLIMLLGKLLLQLYIVTKLSLMDVNFSKTNQNAIHPFENDLLHLCQTILHSSLPQCHAMLTFHIDSNHSKTSSRLLADIIHLLVNCSLRYTKCNNQESDLQIKMMIHTHQWFAKWLAPISSNENQNVASSLYKKSTSIHPLSREIILSTISIHFSYLSQSYSNRQDTSNKNLNHVSMVYLISFFTQLMLDPRTTYIHVKNISSALHRTSSFYRSKDQTFTTTFTQHDFFTIVWKTFIQYKQSNKKNNEMKTMGKFNIPVLNTITLFLEKMPSEIIWSDVKTATNIREFCSTYLKEDNLSIVGKKKGITVLFILTYLNATIMNNPYQLQTNNNEKNRIGMENYFFEKTGIPLHQFYDAQLRKTKTKTKTKMDHSSIFNHIHESILRFIHFMTVLYGSSHVKKLDDFLAISIKQYDTFIQNRNVTHRANTAFRHCMENAMVLGKIGGLMTKNCPRKSLEVNPTHV